MKNITVKAKSVKSLDVITTEETTLYDLRQAIHSLEELHGPATRVRAILMIAGIECALEIIR